MEELVMPTNVSTKPTTTITLFKDDMGRIYHCDGRCPNGNYQLTLTKFCNNKYILTEYTWIESYKNLMSYDIIEIDENDLITYDKDLYNDEEDYTYDEDDDEDEDDDDDGKSPADIHIRNLIDMCIISKNDEAKKQQIKTILNNCRDEYDMSRKLHDVWTGDKSIERFIFQYLNK
jgi:hypothetical protein